MSIRTSTHLDLATPSCYFRDMTERASTEQAAQVLEQSYTLLAAELAALDGVIVDLAQYPTQAATNSNRARVLAARDEIRRAISRNRIAYQAIMGTLDPYGDLYLVQPGAPVSLTPYGVVPKITGFCRYYDDTTVTAIAANTPTALAFPVLSREETQKPADTGTYFVDDRVFGGLRDAMMLRLDLTVRPTDAVDTATTVTVGYTPGVDLSLALFETRSFLDGYNVPVPLSFETTLYVGSDWAADGAQIVVRADGDVEVTSRALLVTRLHKAYA